MKKRALVLSLFFNLLFLFLFSAFIYKKGGVDYLYLKINGLFSETASVNEQFSAKYYSLKTMFEVLPNEENEIIFLGNSITEYCQWNELFSNPKVKNRGIGGDVTEGVLNRLEEIVSSKPKKIFLMVGINDLGRYFPISKIVNNYKTIISVIKNKSPFTQVFLQSVLPVNYQIYGDRIKIEEIIKLNNSIKEIAKQNSLIYVDLFSHLSSSDNQLNKKYTYDGIHLNGQGYLVWKSAIEKYVN